MTLPALILVLLSALGHSSWNYVAKSSKHKVVFLWLMLIASGVIYGIPFWYRLRSHPIPADGWPYILATALIHSIYFTFLGMAYRHGDLSTVYPIARGIAPALVPFVAATWLHEFPSALGAAGIVLVVVGIQIVGLPGLSSFLDKKLEQNFAQAFSKGLSRSSLVRFWHDLSRGPVGFAFLTGLTTTFYTVVDRQGVHRVDPFIYEYLQFVLCALCLMPWMITRKREEIKYEWTANRWRAGVVGLVCFGTYLLVLSAMAMPAVKVSYITAGRECSILFSTLFGILLLREPRGLQKVIGAVIIILGIGCIAFAR